MDPNAFSLDEEILYRRSQGHRTDEPGGNVKVYPSPSADFEPEYQ